MTPRPLLACLLSAVCCAVALPRAAADTQPRVRPPKPAAEAVAAAIADVRSVFQDDIAHAEEFGDPRAVIVAIRQFARDTVAPARKFALLEEAERLAIEAHMFDEAMGVAADKVMQFQVTDIPTRLRVLDAIIDANLVDEVHFGIGVAQASVVAAIAAEDFEAAKAVFSKLESLIKAHAKREKALEDQIRRKYPNLVRSTDVTGKKAAGVKAMTLDQQEKLWKRVFVHRDRDALAERVAALQKEVSVVASRKERCSANSPTASARDARIVAGMYLCFDMSDWEQGLGLLAADQTEFGGLATEELAGRNDSSAGRAFAMANRWWDAAQNIGGDERCIPADAVAIRAHAAALYTKSLAGLTDAFEIKQARARIEEAEAPRVLHAVERDASRCSSASEAVQVYGMFLARETISDATRRAANVRLECWKQRARDRYRRFGDEWVTDDECKARMNQAQNRVTHAIDLIRLRQVNLAKDELDSASRLDCTSGRADYTIGFINSIFFDNDLLAAYYFSEAASREPDNGAYLCALANSEFILDRADEAVKHYVLALDCLPHQFVVENIGTALFHSRGREEKALRRLNDIYRRAVHDLDMKPAENFVYRFMVPLVDDWKKSQGGPQAGRPEMIEEVSIASGTGFIVGPNLVMTNFHVVDGCTDIVIVDPLDRDRKLPAKVVATEPTADLALLECGDLNGPAVSFADELPTRGEDIMCLGFPGGTILGLALKSTKGAVVSLGDPDLEGNFLHSCIINPGNSGGPIVDQAGRLVGVVVAIVKTHAIGNAYSIGIPIERVKPFLSAELSKREKPSTGKSAGDADGTKPGEAKAPAGSDGPAPRVESEHNTVVDETKNLTWAEVDAKVSRSTVFIMGKVSPGQRASGEDRGGDASK